MFDNDYNITGSHATKLKFLAKKNSDENDLSAKIFERYIDVYLNAAVWGLLYNRTAKKNNIDSDRASIRADVFSKERKTCIFLYRMVMLLADPERKRYLSKDQRIDRAFRNDSNGKESLDENLELFHSYVRGGIDILYETFCENLSSSFSREDLMEQIHKTVISFKENLEKNNGDFIPLDKNYDKDFEDQIENILKKD